VSLVCWRVFCLTSGVDERELAGLRLCLEEFAAEVFEGFSRADQRATGLRYLRGLMLDGKRKSMQPMAERLGIDYQQFQQFLTSSTWDYVAVRRRLAGQIVDLVEPAAWVVDDTGFAKNGTASPGVARQYSGTLGKVGNCQVAVSLHAVTDAASGVLGWRLFLPESSWDERSVPVVPEGPEHDQQRAQAEQKTAQIQARRARAKIPDDQRYRAKWQMALELIDEVIGWGHRPPVLVGDAGYGDTTEFRTALSDRDILYVLAVKSSTSAYPAHALPKPASVPVAGAGRQGRPAGPGYRDTATSLKELALQAIRDNPALLQETTWRHGTKTSPDNRSAAMSSPFAALRVRPANRTIPRADDGSLPDCWLLIEWPPDKDEPTDYWLSTLPPDTPLTTLIRLAKIRWRIEHDYRELKDGLGLDHFEGRTFTGWHRHATLVTAAQLFLTRLRLTHPKADGQP
jgi:SRSO17 transposase